MKYGQPAEERSFSFTTTTSVEVTGTLEECRLDQEFAVMGFHVRTEIFNSGTPEVDVFLRLQPLNKAGTLADGRKPIQTRRIYRGDPWYDTAIRECVTEI